MVSDNNGDTARSENGETVDIIIDDVNSDSNNIMKVVLYEVRCLKSNEDVILALAGQFKQLSHEPEKFR